MLQCTMCNATLKSSTRAYLVTDNNLGYLDIDNWYKSKLNHKPNLNHPMMDVLLLFIPNNY